MGSLGMDTPGSRILKADGIIMICSLQYMFSEVIQRASGKAALTLQ